MVDVTDGPDVHMGLVAFELGFRHLLSLLLISGFVRLHETNLKKIPALVRRRC
jgi:hypothetical protein